MRKLLLTTAALLLGSAAHAQTRVLCGQDYCFNRVYTSTLTTTSCCASSDDGSTVAYWAVELQLHSWWHKKDPSTLTRSELNARRTYLKTLCDWAAKLDNKLFASAYERWAQEASAQLDARSTKLDHNDIALSILGGLPSLPPGEPQ